MIFVLFRLQWMLLKGRVIRSIRLLRQPKYLAGFVVGAGWMGLWVLRPLLRSKISIASAPVSQFDMSWMPAIHQLAALFVTIALPLPWLWPWGDLGLPFREAELTMLLQAPLTRRQVIQYGLLKSEAKVLLSAFVLPLIAGIGGPFSRLLMGCGTWMLFEFWHLNGKWRALFNLRQTERQAPLARRLRWLLTIGLAGFYLVLVFTLKPFVLQVARIASAGSDSRVVVASLKAVAWPPFLEALLKPAWWLTAPIFAAGKEALLIAAVPMLLAIFAQREIVLRSKARFEESALRHATKEEAKKSPTRRFGRISSRGRTMRPFELDRPGPPEVALIWKNAISVSRVRWTHLAVFGAALCVAIALLPALLHLNNVVYGIVASVGLFPMIILPVLAGMTWNNDLRTELAHIELVRTWPVSARRFVLAEVLSPAIFSFASAVLGAGVMLVTLPRVGRFMGTQSGPAALVLAVSFLPLAAALSFFSSALQNLAILFVPAWMAHSVDRSKGVAAFGQRMLVSGALALALFFALLPSALLVGAAAGVQWWLDIPWSAWAFPFWGLLAAAPLFVMGWMIVQVAGGLWEQLDPSQEILELGR